VSSFLQALVDLLQAIDGGYDGSGGVDNDLIAQVFVFLYDESSVPAITSKGITGSGI
jgi:hypothetical protein